MANPSALETNRAVRVLAGKRLKYTVTLNIPGQEPVEFQCPQVPKLVWSDSHRGFILEGRAGEGYQTDYTIMIIGATGAGVLVTAELNPEHEEK